ncbi:G-protein alpha subunit [Lactarius tabidus]
MTIGALASWRVQDAQKQVARRAKAHSDEIDLRIKEDSKRLQRKCDILLMGCNNYDISTFVKQMKIIHQHGYTHEERIEFRPTIWKDLLKTSRRIVQVLRALHAEPATDSSEAHWECIANHPTAIVDADFSLNPDLAEAVRDLWADDMIPVLLDSLSQFSLPESAAYFVSEIHRITTRDYIPSNEDILRAPMRTDVGVTETYIDMGRLSLRLCHVSRQWSERKKWIHLFEGVTSIIFCVPLSDYDVVECGQNRMTEALVLFESVVNSRWFLRTSVILFLTRIDEFKSKLPKTPLEKYFPEYTGGADVNKAAKYILWRFMQANRARLSVYPHIAQPTDRSNILLIFVAVKETILLRCYNVK